MAGALVCALVLAQDYPARPVKIIVPFAAGGPADVYARFLGQRLQETLGQPFAIEDRPGAGSLIGTEAVAKSAPDGYSLLLMSNTHTVNESLVPNKPYALLRDFVPVASIITRISCSWFTRRSTCKASPISSSSPRQIPESSTTPRPGPERRTTSPASSSSRWRGVDIVHVPYKGSSDARTDLLGGQAQMMFDADTTMGEHARSGRVKALGTTGKTRSTALPAVPTLDEAGVPGYEAVIGSASSRRKVRRAPSSIG